MNFSLKELEKNFIGVEAYSECRQEICQYNRKTLQQVSFVGMILGTVLVIISILPFEILKLLGGYVSIAVVFAVIFALTCTVLKKNDQLVLPVYYALMILLLAIGIVMGTFLGRTTNATTFVMLIITLPLFIIDRPYRLNLVFGIMCLLFCVMDFSMKDKHLSMVDTTNCIVFYILSIITSRQAIHAKMSDMIIKRELKKQLDIDMLTKLGNRTAFERIVDQYVHESNKDAMVIIMDIDNFKSVNDIMGHSYGDMVLQLVGEYLKSSFRMGDFVSRLGGDEFVVFLPAVSDMNAITEKIEGLIKKIESIEIESDQPCKISASLGIARYPDDGCTFENLYKRADTALYQAKRNGKGQYRIYEENNA